MRWLSILSLVILLWVIFTAELVRSRRELTESLLLTYC